MPRTSNDVACSERYTLVSSTFKSVLYWHSGICTLLLAHRHRTLDAVSRSCWPITGTIRALALQLHRKPCSTDMDVVFVLAGGLNKVTYLPEVT